MTVYSDFAHLLNHYLTGQERSLSWLSRQLKCNPSTVHRWANGETRPRDSAMIKAMLQLFNITEPQAQQTFLVAAGFLDLELVTNPRLNQPADEVMTPIAPTYDFIAFDDYWVGRDALVQQLSQRIQTNYRLILLSGMAGIGKTALAERIALTLTPWLATPQAITRLNFDYQGRDVDFANIALGWLKGWDDQFELDDRPAPDKLLSHVIQMLSQQQHLIIIDSLEKAKPNPSDDNRVGSIDSGWADFFQALLAAETMLSRVIITTQELPEQVIRYGKQYRNRFWRETLTGLSETEQAALFQKAGLGVHSDQLAHRYLQQISQAYAGHPLALRAIIGEIKDVFAGDIVAYWQTYGHEFEQVAQGMSVALQSGQNKAVDDWRLDRFSLELQRQVRHRLNDTIARLRQQAPDAYLLLCAAAEYHTPVTARFWQIQLAGRGRNEAQQQAALHLLVERSLVEQSRDSQHDLLFGLHNLVRSVALDHRGNLSSQHLAGQIITIRLRSASWKLLANLEIEPETMIPSLSPPKLSAYLAAVCWLTDYTEVGNRSPEIQIKDFLQACHCFCNAETWVEAWKLLSTPLFDSIHQTLAEQIDAHRFGAEQVAIYSRLSGKLDRLANAHCLRGLGQGYYNMDDKFEMQQTEAYLQAALKEFRELGAVDQVGWTLQVLGVVALYFSGNQPDAQTYFTEAVAIFHQLGDNKGLAHTLHNLARIHNNQGHYEEARQLYKENLDILYNHLPHADVVQNGWAHLTYAQFLLSQGEFDEAQKHIQRSFKYFKKLRHQSGLLWAYINLASLLVHRQRHWFTCVVLHKLSTEFCNTTDVTHASAVVHHLTGSYRLMKRDYKEAAQSFQTTLAIFKKLDYLPGYVDVFPSAALVAFHTDQGELAVRLLAATETVRQKTKIIIKPSNHIRNENLVNTLRTQLGVSAFQHAWHLGQSMAVEEAVMAVITMAPSSIHIKN